MTIRINTTPRRLHTERPTQPRPRWTLQSSFDSPIPGVRMYEDEPVKVAGYVPPPNPAPVLTDGGIYF